MDTILEVHRQSRGLPRLVNTLCENALIHGYARQLATIPPEIIEEIAADFRLNVEHAPIQTGQVGDLQRKLRRRQGPCLISIRICGMRSRTNAELRVVVGAGARKNEPYI